MWPSHAKVGGNAAPSSRAYLSSGQLGQSVRRYMRADDRAQHVGLSEACALSTHTTSSGGAGDARIEAPTSVIHAPGAGQTLVWVRSG